MTVAVILVFLFACLGVIAIAAALMGGGVKGIRDEVYQHDKHNDLDGFSALFVSGAMTVVGSFTLFFMLAVILFCVWRVIGAAF